MTRLRVLLGFPGGATVAHTPLSRRELVVQEDTTAKLLKQLFSYELNWAVLSPGRACAFGGHGTVSDELLLALPHGHELCRQRRRSGADLAEERFTTVRERRCLPHHPRDVS